MNKIANVVQEGRFVKVYLNGTDISKDVPQAIRLAARNSGFPPSSEQVRLEFFAPLPMGIHFGK